MQRLAKYLYPRGSEKPKGCQRVDNLFTQPHRSNEEGESCWLCAAGPAHTDLTCCPCQNLPNNTEALINKLSFSQGRCQQTGWHAGKPNPVNRISCSCLKSTPLPIGLRRRFCLCRPTVHKIRNGQVWILCTEWVDAQTETDNIILWHKWEGKIHQPVGQNSIQTCACPLSIPRKSWSLSLRHNLPLCTLDSSKQRDLNIFLILALPYRHVSAPPVLTEVSLFVEPYKKHFGFTHGTPSSALGMGLKPSLRPWAGHSGPVLPY